MGFKGARGLAFLILLMAVAGPAKGQPAAQLDALCQLPAPTASQAGARADRDAQLRRAGLAFEQDRYAESLSALHAAYAAEPSADILFNMGQACLATGRQEEAFAFYTRAQSESPSQEARAKIASRLEQLRPRLAKALTLKALLLGSQEKYAESCAMWSRAYDLDSRPLYLLQLADALRQAGRTDEALANYERLLHVPGAEDIGAIAGRRIAALREPSAVSAPTAVPASASAPAPVPALNGPSALTAEPAAVRRERAPLYRKWWFWTIVAGSAVTVGLAAGLGARAALAQPSFPDLRPISF